MSATNDLRGRRGTVRAGEVCKVFLLEFLEEVGEDKGEGVVDDVILRLVSVVLPSFVTACHGLLFQPLHPAPLLWFDRLL